jgi:hypothetical protein
LNSLLIVNEKTDQVVAEKEKYDTAYTTYYRGKNNCKNKSLFEPFYFIRGEGLIPKNSLREGASGRS